MTTVTSKAPILPLSLIFILVLGSTRPCVAGSTDQPEQIIRKMYRDLLDRNFAEDTTSKNNRAKYFVQSLVRLYDANDAAEASGKPPCADFSIQVNGQDFDANEVRKSLSIEQTSNDGARAEIVSKPGPADTFRYEFVKDSGRWKISDVILPWGERLSHTACSESSPLPVHAADTPERWLASSHTATAITGDVRFSPSKVWMASTSGATKPKDMSDICGTYGYEPAPSFSMTGKPTFRRHFGMDAPGNDRGSWIRHVGTVDACETLCLADPGCAGYTYNTRRSTCIPKNSIGALVRHNENPVTGVILGRGGTTALNAESSPAGKPDAPQSVHVKNGIYCIKPTHRSNGELADGVLAVRHESDNDLKISFEIGHPERNDAVSSLYGVAKRVSANHWLYQEDMNSADPDDRCAVDIALDKKGWHLNTREGAGCVKSRGHDAQYAETPDFPLDSYVGPVTPAQVDDLAKLSTLCSFPHTPAQAREIPGAQAHAKSGQPSYVGRWMDNPTCQPPYENELNFSEGSMDGDELSCRFDRIRGGAGRWHIRMTCHGEGGRNEERWTSSLIGTPCSLRKAAILRRRPDALNPTIGLGELTAAGLFASGGGSYRSVSGGPVQVI